MRTNRFFGLFAALLLFTFVGYAQHTIRLNCDTNRIINGEKATEACRFEGQPEDVPTDLYEYPVGLFDYVEIDQEVIWEAYDQNGEALRNLRVRYKGGKRVFSWPEGRKDADNDGKVRGTPQSTGRFLYYISFVLPGEGRVRIDPELKVGP